MHNQTKRIEVDRHFIQEKLDSNLTCTSYVPSQGQPLQIFLPKYCAIQILKIFVDGPYVIVNKIARHKKNNSLFVHLHDSTEDDAKYHSKFQIPHLSVLVKMLSHVMMYGSDKWNPLVKNLLSDNNYSPIITAHIM